MKHPKQYYRGLNFSGFRWFCYESGWHLFSKKVGEKYAQMKCTEQDIEDGNAEEMAREGLTK